MKKISFLITAALLTGCSNISKTASYELEYGKPLDVEIIEKECSVTDLDISSITMENEQDYPAVGEYVLQAQDGEVTLIVKDTTKPEIVTDSLTVELNGQTDFKDRIEVNDLSECTVTVDTSKVDFTVPGEYTIMAKAVDASGNEAEKDITVIVEERTIETPETVSEPFYVNGIMIVNKKHPLPMNYAYGEDPTASAAIHQLIADMQALGYDISNNYSGYRSYDTQNGLYWSYVSSYGQAEADTFSARPGYSEHQTGLAYDLMHTSGALVTNQPEADWIAQNAHRYGFIVRYQEGKEDITGYVAEQWHLRYIGDEATKIYESGLTLEEYLGIEGGDYQS
ncbi:MAG: D-alanyl-D-alanine carboxypeptidase family protein [Faecalicoccus sp.]|nr:D-alanyl-D-alanine carboxypeptidase family protein [Faecalicoccus sp.]